ncbi:pectinesterase [Catalinimonas alkaloidigena]|uniref:Pectinesterase n=1 Tax=Catalinimonas alkaloidigena TaxID=1075417 RepID=A0A1G9GR41_9BACT|nr:pectinesterase family protein [Catalinimonas alkaloidigena]SDL03118.1 pectinesterase [Catalinimonas alkaloidigena]
MKTPCRFSFFLLLSWLTLASAWAQQVPSSATWPLTNPDADGTGFAPVTTGLVAATDERLSNLELNQYTGLEESQRLRIQGNEWPANQTDTIAGTYVEFAVAPNEGTTFMVDTLSLRLAARSISSMRARIFYAASPDFSEAMELMYDTGLENNYLSVDTLMTFSGAPEVQLAEGDTFYLRIYPWVDQDPDVRTGKYLLPNNVMIGGQSKALPASSTALWSFNDTQEPVTTGGMVAELPAFEGLEFYNFTELPIDGTSEQVKVISLKTPGEGEWIAEPDSVGGMYAQFAAAPKSGGTLAVEEVSFYIGGWFTSTLRATVYASTDPTFATSTLLVADSALVGNAVASWTFPVEAMVESGGQFYLRIYPYNTEAQGWAKLVALKDVTISGTVSGVTADPAAISSQPVSAISTTFATSGGNIYTDGGAPVTARGVVWNTTGSPTVDDSKTEDGTGPGTFSSQLTGLTPGTQYYVRAYATNSAGTSYGGEVSFTTLTERSVPTVTTGQISNILAEEAVGSGEVTDWGGDTITARGLVWNTTGAPTLADAYSEAGAGLGAFQSALMPLEENTDYYVRAYATNGVGTAYGDEVTFTTEAKAPDVMVTVAQDGSGDYETVQAAFDAVPDNYTGTYTIYVKPGTYKEKLILERNKVNVVLKGDDPLTTILTYDDYAGIAGGTSNSYSVAIEPDDFTAMNITFQNTVVNDGSGGGQQAVALRVNGDRQAYYNCRLLGYQDTFYTWGGRGTGRIYLKDCYVEGSVDFIFGRDIVVFDHCELHVNRNGGALTAAATEAVSKFGYVFLNNTITADSVGFDGTPITSFILGRPWQDAPRTVFVQCEEPASLSPAGWSTWNVKPALYAEYQCFGPGSDVSQRISISQQLTDEEAAQYTIANIFAQGSHPRFDRDWLPADTTVTSSKGWTQPVSSRLEQNYPNPLRDLTSIGYELLTPTPVRLVLYNTLGQPVRTLVDRRQTPGTYRVAFDGQGLSNGVYFYTLFTNEGSQTRRMLLQR